jgi:hypothetical protein
MKILIQIFIAFAFCLFTFDLPLAATGCSYPTSLDTYSDKSTGDFLTTGDVNSRSCAIEQLELRLNQLLVGRSGGNTITGGTGAGQNLTFTSTSSATKGKIVLGATSAFDEVNNRLGLGTTAPSRQIETYSSNPLTMYLQVNAAATGPHIDLVHNGLVNEVANIGFSSLDTGTIIRNTHYIQAWLSDGTSGSMDSEFRFCVTSNGTSCNTVATLSTLGVWADSSSAELKDYEGDMTGVIDKLKQIKTLGVYRGKNIPANKIKTTERHYSPTAQEFSSLFNLGRPNSLTIAPKDVGWIAIKAILELEARIQALEKK